MSTKQWVEARAQCNPRAQFEKLGERVRRDVQEFNAILKEMGSVAEVLVGPNYEKRPSDDFQIGRRFYVYAWCHDNPVYWHTALVAFELEYHLKESIRAATVGEKSYQIVPTWVPEKGQCRLEVSDEEGSEKRLYKLWQVSDLVLGPYFELVLKDAPGLR